MKTANWLLSILAALLWTTPVSASLFLAWEEDLRGVYSEKDGVEGEINSVGASVRKVFSDARGDRLTLYVQAEAAHNLSEGMVHQAYGEWKGPMGRWNVAAGRVPLPWGLLTGWSPDRMPYASPYTGTRMLSSDNGALLRGVIRSWDYGLALTQGYGMDSVREYPGPGLVTGRIGLTPGLSGDFTLGFSLSSGTVYASEHGHGLGEVYPEKRTAFALDSTWHLGRGTYRFEGGARRTDEQWLGTGFIAADYALLPRAALQMAGHLYRAVESHNAGRLYVGISIPLPFVTIRGGYEYEKSHSESHKVVVQFYRLYTAAR